MKLKKIGTKQASIIINKYKKISEINIFFIAHI